MYACYCASKNTPGNFTECGLVFPNREKDATVFPNEMIENDNRSDSSSQKSKK